MRKPVLRRASVGIAALTLALAAAPARAGGPLEWNLSNCAEQHGANLTLSICGPGCSFTAVASFVAPVQGTIILPADFAISGSTQFTELRVTAGGKTVGYKYLGSPCAPSPCSGSLPPIVAHLLAGEVLLITLQEQELMCDGGGGITTVSFHDIDFVPDVGFVTGPGALDGSLLATAKGPHEQARLGQAVVLTGDLDGDGIGDAAASGSGTTGPDFVRFVSGATGATLFDALSTGFDAFGESLAAIGDLDGDGRTDVVAGVGDGNNGPARVLSGADGHVLLSIPAPGPNEQFAKSVSAAGDLDGDGVPDVLVGAPYAKPGGVNTGAARVYSGATGALLLEVSGAAGDEVGHSVASTGDVNGDGVPDLVVGAKGADVGAVNTGVIRVHSGADGVLLHELVGATLASSFWPRVLGAAGDLDGDGVGDVLGGDWAVDMGGHNAGVVRAYSGATGALLFELLGNEYDGLGYSVCAAGDWDGDGRDDAAISSEVGYVLVVSGATHEVLEQIVLGGIVDAVAPNQAAVAICAGGVDVDGDGHRDFAVGLPGANFIPGLGNAGKVVFVSGNPPDHVAPTLTGTGSLLPATPLRLDIAGGDALAQAILVAGASMVNLPFKGGLLVPAPNVIFAFPLNAAGASTLMGTWPAGIPAGASIWLQAWIADDDGPAGVVASAALQIITP